MDLQALAYELAENYGYRYTRSVEYSSLDYSERIKINNMVFFILEMEM